MGSASIILILGFGGSPALANTESHDSEVVTIKVPMTYGPFDREAAAANGYDIRTDDRGVDYSIPATTPLGDLTGAKYIPGQEPSASTGGVTTFGTVAGDCGTSTFTGYGSNFQTAWAITDLWVGPSYYHEWRVAVSSSLGYQTWNLDGLSSGYAWATSRSIPFSGYPYYGYVSHGKVSTSLGFACYSYNPADRWYS